MSNSRTISKFLPAWCYGGFWSLFTAFKHSLASLFKSVFKCRSCSSHCTKKKRKKEIFSPGRLVGI